MKIGLDFDDVIAHSQSVKPLAAMELFGVLIPANVFSKDLILRSEELTLGEYQEVVSRVYQGRYDLPEVPGALGSIRQLLSEGHSIRVVTNRSDAHRSLAPAIKWLESKGLNLEVKGVPYGEPKTPFCKDLDVFVDDERNNLERLVGIVPKLIFFQWPHQPKPTNDQIHLVSSWAEVLQHISQSPEHQ